MEQMCSNQVNKFISFCSFVISRSGVRPSSPAPLKNQAEINAVESGLYPFPQYDPPNIQKENKQMNKRLNSSEVLSALPVSTVLDISVAASRMLSRVTFLLVSTSKIIEGITI